jgi:hypothetical protein
MFGGYAVAASGASDVIKAVNLVFIGAFRGAFYTLHIYNVSF